MAQVSAARFAGGLALGLWACASGAGAQDRFDAKVPAYRPDAVPPASAGAQAQPPNLAAVAQPAQPPRDGPASRRSAASPVDAEEAQDYGVRAVAALRPTNQLHGPTPATIPGGNVVGTRQLAEWMQDQRGPQGGRVMLLHAIASDAHLPNAIPAAPAARGGSFDDAVQREFAAWLEQATGGDRSRLIVTYCLGVQCWGSYNAALRAIRMGYRNVHWYRGGMEAWRRAGLPIFGPGAARQANTPAR